MVEKRKKSGANRRRQVIGLILAVFAIFLLISLVTHEVADDFRLTGSEDPSLSPFDADFVNQAGMVGSLLSYVMFTLLGGLSFFIPVAIAFASLRFLASGIAPRLELNILVLWAVSLFASMIINISEISPTATTLTVDGVGGWVAEILTILAVRVIGPAGSYVTLAGLIVLAMVLFTSLQIRLPKGETVRNAVSPLGAFWARLKAREWMSVIHRKDKQKEEAAERSERESESRPAEQLVMPIHGMDTRPELEELQAAAKRGGRKATITRPSEINLHDGRPYTFPGLDLLTENPSSGPSTSPEELNQSARMLRETLETFGISIEGNITFFPGPVITRFEFKPGVGVKVNQIWNLADDLALALKAKRIRIIAPIPGKAAVGVEIPNRFPQTVYMRDILQSESFQADTTSLPLALGKSTSGQPIIVDLGKMPHLLIAGATGSGKSVCMNVLITSLMYRLHPQQIRFVFIDPKMLELSVYSGVPHLARPVITTAKRAEKVLTEMVNEMEMRYRKLATVSVRNINDFNRKQTVESEKLPYIVIFVDELADLMMASTQSRTELLITRLAQMSRAVGIHLVLATQRPSVDVITGLIKANFPARIAFQVSSKVDSRTILDGNGAEKLLGNGDMLFLAPGQPEAIRIHGAYLTSDETDRIVTFIKGQNLESSAPETVDTTTADDGGDEGDVDFGDPLFKEACEVVVRHKQGSVSLLQRRLGIGYQRAARLIDKLEEAGIVSPFDGSKAREVIVDKAHIDALFAGGRAASLATEAEKN